jgi:serine protease SohB
MIDFLAEYGLFLLKVATVIIGIVVIIAAVASAGRRASHQEGLEVEDLNKKYQSMAAMLKQAVMKKSEWKAEAKAQKQKDKSLATEERPRVFVIDFKGDLKASAVPSLREEINSVLDVVREQDQIVVRLENYGGVVHEHGLAASQLARIREHNVPLTICVDKVAASGGYLMASVANEICVAPFAILGSIGVIAQIPNFHKLMDEHGVGFEQITAGKYKRTVTMFGENTDADRAKLKQELEEVHLMFIEAVSQYRPDLDLEKVATGEHWYGSRAIELGLADQLKTSDDLLATLAADRDLYRVTYKVKQPLRKSRLINRARGCSGFFDWLISSPIFMFGGNS